MRKTRYVVCIYLKEAKVKLYVKEYNASSHKNGVNAYRHMDSPVTASNYFYLYQAKLVRDICQQYVLGLNNYVIEQIEILTI